MAPFFAAIDTFIGVETEWKNPIRELDETPYGQNSRADGTGHFQLQASDRISQSENPAGRVL